MQTTYLKKSGTVQKTAAVSASSVLDSSSQSKSLQHKADIANSAVQREERPNNTGMPDNLKAGIENLSGFSMDNVRVHYNSSKPATVQALAYTQGTDIHVAPGQEKCLPHEAWHVAQQMAGRVSPTTNINGMPVNDNVALEHEADVMGEKAIQCKNTNSAMKKKSFRMSDVVQGNFYVKHKVGKEFFYVWHPENVDFFQFQRIDEWRKWNNNDQPNYDFVWDDLKKWVPRKDGPFYYPVYIPLKRFNVLYNENNLSDPHIKKDAILAGERRAKKRGQKVDVKKIEELIGVGVSDDILIVSHGSRPTSSEESEFTDYSARELAAVMIDKLPNEYCGEIYLDGCHTGEPRKRLNDGSSFAERFGNYLKEMAKKKNKNMIFRVKGNLGSAATECSSKKEELGSELIVLDEKTISLIKENLVSRIDDVLKYRTFPNLILGSFLPLDSMRTYFRNKLAFVEKDVKVKDSLLRHCMYIGLTQCTEISPEEILRDLEMQDKLISKWLESGESTKFIKNYYYNKNGPNLRKKGKKRYFPGKFGKRIYEFDTNQ